MNIYIYIYIYIYIDRTNKLFESHRINGIDRRLERKKSLDEPRSLLKPYFSAVPHANEVSIS